MELTLSSDGAKILKEWIDVLRSERRDYERITETRIRLAQAEQKVGEWMCPKDAVAGEQFNIAIGNGFLSVKKLAEDNGYSVNWRIKPTDKRSSFFD